jgi:hypothetical protein
MAFPERGINRHQGSVEAAAAEYTKSSNRRFRAISRLELIRWRSTSNYVRARPGPRAMPQIRLFSRSRRPDCEQAICFAQKSLNRFGHKQLSLYAVIALLALLWIGSPRGQVVLRLKWKGRNVA